MAYNYKGKAKAEWVIIINIKRNRSIILLRPFRTPLRSFIFIDDLINDKNKDRLYSRKKFIKFADPLKFFN